MSKTPKFDDKIEELLVKEPLGERTCALTQEKWQFDQREMDWCQKFQAPPSRYAPHTRVLLLTSFRTAFEIFWNKHAWTGEPILTYIHPDIQIPIITDNEWHEMDVDARPEYQATVDPQKPFFEQFLDLHQRVPMGARREWKNIVNTVGVGMWDVEDCYLVFSTVESKRVMYAYYCLAGSEDITQGAFVQVSQNCWNVTRVERCHSCNVALESRDCLNCSFIFDCRNCEHCFGATNLRNRKYVFFNDQLSKEEYEKRVAAIDLSCRSTYKDYYGRFIKLVDSSAFPESFNLNSPECSGEYLFDCVRTHDSYYMQKCTDCSYNYGSKSSENCHYVASAYEGTVDGWMSSQLWSTANAKYCMNIGQSQNMEYCFNCYNCENCFGCVGLERKKFHVFNKPYAEEEYWRLVDEIKCTMLDRGEYGEFFPLSTSPNGMQFSMTPVLHDLSEEEMKKLGAPIYDPDRGAVLAPQKVQETLPLDITQVPDCLKEIDPAKWVGKPFMDRGVNRRWTVVPQEFDFYRSHNLPFPEEHYSSRLRRQIQMMNLNEYEKTSCVVCQKSIRVAKNKTFLNRRVHCLECYLKYLESR